MMNKATESQDSGSSQENVSLPKFSCPLILEGLPASQEPNSLFKLSRMSHDEFSKLDEGENNTNSTSEFKTAQLELENLGRTTSERVKYLKEKLEELKVWIFGSFGVDNVTSLYDKCHQQQLGKLENDISKLGEVGITDVNAPANLNTKYHHLLLMQNKVSLTPYRLNNEETTSLTSQNSSHGKVEPNAATPEESRPVLRIKLIDDKTRAAIANVPNSTASTTTTTLRYGTGSKNLSRIMSKPDTSAEAKAKVANQTPINVFLNYVEPFFKIIDDTDVRNMDDVTSFIDPTHFVIPPLGRFYEDQWKESYGYICNNSRSRSRDRDRDSNNPEITPVDTRPISIRDRLLSMLIEENLKVPETTETNSSDSISAGDNEPHSIENLNNYSISDFCTKKVDFNHVDERIRQELTNSGLQMFVPKIDYQEDDAICAEMRTLQRKLREQVCLNHYRKRKLAELVRKKLPAQEFYTLLGDIDKQIEQTFAKRSKIQKKKKKPTQPGLGTSPSPVYSAQEEIPLIETRRKLITSFADIIPSHHEFLSTKAEHIFDDSVEEKVLLYANETGNWLPIPEQPLQHIKLSRIAAHPVFPTIVISPSTAESSSSKEII